MNKITTIGLDLAKSVFQAHAIDQHGKKIFNKSIKRKSLILFFANIEPCLVGMEACGGANYWARRLKGLGHEVKIIPAQYVKPYVKTHKNDAVDAEAIAEAVTRPSMRFVSIKSVDQQDVQCLHRIRTRYIKNRTALSNEMRGLLTEYGIVFAIGIRKLKEKIPRFLEDPDNELTGLTRDLIQMLYSEFLEVSNRIKEMDERINTVLKNSERCKKIKSVPGIGPLAATIINAKVANASDFKNGRQFAAFLGLVPRQCSSGGKTKLLSTSKKGDPYIRQLLILGAKSVLMRCETRTDNFGLWAQKIKKNKNPNVATVAVANKIARIAWVTMKEDRMLTF
jgi:transposase